MRTFALAVLGLFVSAGVQAQSLDLPAVKAGDTWTYIDTTEKGPSGWAQTHDQITVSRVTTASIYYTSKQSGSTLTPRERFCAADWSRVRDVNGKETTVNRPLAFPLEVGKTWEVRYSEQHPNKVHKLEQWNSKFTVVGYETIEVPAGKFKALKVEAEGQWSAEMEPANTVVQGAKATQETTTMVTQVSRSGTSLATGRIYEAFWYVPEIKRWVKSVEEYYGSGGERNERYSSELESFKLN